VRLAQQPGVAQTTQQLADATRVPQSYLPKVLQPLARAGIVMAQRGSHGGYSLHADPAMLSVMDVIACVDPVRRIDTCPGRDAINGAALCNLHQLLDADLAASEARFREATIQQLLPQGETPLPDAVPAAEMEPAN
jgi:Rrf2 family nitric oxide-sensitive transcriptional repressor